MMNKQVITELGKITSRDLLLISEGDFKVEYQSKGPYSKTNASIYRNKEGTVLKTSNLSKYIKSGWVKSTKQGLKLTSTGKKALHESISMNPKTIGNIMKKSELRQIIREEIQLIKEGHVHHDFGKFVGDLTNANTVWLYPSKGAYDFKKEIRKLGKAFGKMKVYNREMDSVEIKFEEPIQDERNWWKAI